MKRLTWFVSGVVTGVTGVFYGSHKIKQKTELLKPVNVAKGVAEKVRDRVEDVVDAVRGGREAMQDKELELRARRDGDVLDTEVVSVEPGRVVVLRAARDRRERRRRA